MRQVVFITVHYNKEKVKKKNPHGADRISMHASALIAFFFFFLSAMSFDGYFTFGGVYRASEFVVTVVTVSSLECRVPKRSVVECSTLGHVTYSDKKLEAMPSLARIITPAVRSAILCLGESPFASVYAPFAWSNIFADCFMLLNSAFDVKQQQS